MRAFNALGAVDGRAMPVPDTGTRRTGMIDRSKRALALLRADGMLTVGFAVTTTLLTIGLVAVLREVPVLLSPIVGMAGGLVPLLVLSTFMILVAGRSRGMAWTTHEAARMAMGRTGRLLSAVARLCAVAFVVGSVAAMVIDGPAGSTSFSLVCMALLLPLSMVATIVASMGKEMEPANTLARSARILWTDRSQLVASSLLTVAGWALITSLLGPRPADQGQAHFWLVACPYYAGISVYWLVATAYWVLYYEDMRGLSRDK